MANANKLRSSANHTAARLCSMVMESLPILYPDSTSHYEHSAGALFLINVQNEFNDAMNDGMSEYDWDTTIFEIADGAPSTYTSQAWKEYVDLGAYEMNTSDIMNADGSGLTRSVCYPALSEIARVLLQALWTERNGNA